MEWRVVYTAKYSFPRLISLATLWSVLGVQTLNLCVVAWYSRTRWYFFLWITMLKMPLLPSNAFGGYYLLIFFHTCGILAIYIPWNRRTHMATCFQKGVEGQREGVHLTTHYVHNTWSSNAFLFLGCLPPLSLFSTSSVQGLEGQAASLPPAFVVKSWRMRA